MSVVGKTKPSSDPSHNVLRSETASPLDAIFRPESVAVIGATDREGSVGRAVLANLKRDFKGRIYGVNPSRKEVLGVPCFPNIGALPETLDQAVIVTPAPTVPNVMRECVAAGVRSAVIITAGFKEHGEAGMALEREIKEIIRGTNLRVIGPNCVGVMNPLIGLNATFAHAIARPGNVAFLSQSGALLVAILDWSLRELVGFSAFVSTGSMLDVDWGDLIYYLGDDPHTQSILIYMESIGDARSFLSAAREVALTKPIIVIKAGRTEAASKAAASHTGSLTGSDDVLEAAFRRCGVLRVQSIADLFYMAEVLGRQPRPQGPRLTIVTNAGGPGVLATDALISNGGELTQLAPETLRKLDEFLPPHWSHGNPIDILGDAGPDRYRKTLEIAAQDPNSDGLLTILIPQGMNDMTITAGHIAEHAHMFGKPMLASLMGGSAIAKSEEMLNAKGIPTFLFPDTAARAFDYMWRYTYNLKGLYETPVLAEEPGAAANRMAAVRKIVDEARAKQRTILTEYESKQILGLYGIPTVETLVATSADEAVKLAKKLGFPAVLKLHSLSVTHKTDVGGVQLNLADEAAVRRAFDDIQTSVAQKAGKGAFQGVAVQRMVKFDGYELIIGSSLDPQFGPVILFGAGGQLVEVFQDRALALPPLNTTLARRMMEQTRIFKALGGVRGRKAVDIGELERLLVLFSYLVVEQPWIKEVDINPLLASPERLVALDARVVLHAPDAKDEQLSHAAVRAYPAQYVSAWKMKNGKEVTIRPIRPEDEPLMVQFHKTLSERSVYLRYFHMANLDWRTAHERLQRICFIDYDREMALVVEQRDPISGSRHLLAIGRLSKLHGTNQAEFSVLVADQYQRQGLGSELLQRLIQVGRDEKLARITANVLPENTEMQTVLQRLGFEVHTAEDGTLLAAEIRL
ncbi:MAG TPA: bifunctional acetate--CoA ligase family protein/GNAT family N-acetyltransferase [Terriglobales bacterium]|nr:bifunctional acetate--CoA ligase family protein/GNAT family N-acetyltransferase [Terriglobales bacterium]